MSAQIYFCSNTKQLSQSIWRFHHLEQSIRISGDIVWTETSFFYLRYECSLVVKMMLGHLSSILQLAVHDR